MRVRLRFFASLRERLGTEAERSLRNGTTVGGVWQDLVRKHPEIGCVQVRFAVNESYVEPSHTLRDGDELAFFPPVSGGSVSMFAVTDQPIDVARLLAAVGDPAAGASVLFLGTTRNANAGRRVVRLEYEAFTSMAVKEMRRLAERARRRWPLRQVAMVHRIGVVPVAEASVAIAVSAGHRAEAFEACHWLIDRLKEIVPIWKKEHFRGGTVWIGAQQGAPPAPTRRRAGRAEVQAPRRARATARNTRRRRRAP